MMVFREEEAIRSEDEDEESADENGEDASAVEDSDI